jgi:hypothetical protein
LLEVLEGRTAPAVFTVNTFDDTVEATRDGSGLDATGNVSLRSAAMATNDLGGSNTIVLSAGTYKLTIPPVPGGGDVGGHLNIGRGLTTNNVTIDGATDGATIIDANRLDHAIDVGFFCSATLSRLTIQNGSGTFGGDVGNSGKLTIDNSTITGGTATFGGGVFSNGGTLTITNSTVANNGTTGTTWGGGLFAQGATVRLTNDSLANNRGSIGAGLFLNGGTATITSSTIANNSASTWGGGTYNQAATITLANDTLADNSATEGGGIYTFGFGARISLTNCTIADNACTGFGTEGGGIYQGIGNPTTILTNTIVAGNTAGADPDIDGAITSQGHNLIGNSQDASGFVDTDFVGTAVNPLDPLLGPLQDNGGPTQTMALLPGSPALNAGDPAQLGTADQRGVVRSGGVNVGAYQASASAFVLTALDTVQAGVPFDVTVQAVDVFGQVALGYTGTVTFSTTDTDPGVVLPDDYTFTAADQGTHTFTGGVTLVTPGNQTLTVSDPAGGFSASLTVTVQG